MHKKHGPTDDQLFEVILSSYVCLPSNSLYFVSLPQRIIETRTNNL